MAQHAQQACDLATVRRNRDPRVVILAEDLIQDGQRPELLRTCGLRGDAIPELVILVEASLESVSGKSIMD